MNLPKLATSAAALLLLAPLVGCSSEQEQYCQAVKDHQ